MKLGLYLKTFRFDHWIKNIFMLIGAVGSLIYFRIPIDATVCIHLVLGFFLSCLISSVNYIINEILDAPFDKLHMIKKNRPIPAGKIRVWVLWICVFVLLITVGTISYGHFNYKFNYALLALLIAGLCYNLRPIRLKDIPYMDVVAESINNPIRLFIGWFTLSQVDQWPPMTLIWIFWSFGAFLMTAKRLAEFRLLGRRAVPYRSVFKYYSQAGLFTVMVLYAFIAVVLYWELIYLFEEKLIYSFPFFLWFIVWFIFLTMQKRSIVIEPEHLIRKPLFLFYCIFMSIFTFIVVAL